MIASSKLAPVIGEIGSLDPEVYLALHQGVEGDIAFYTGLVSAWINERGTAPRVLELGCGGGRLLKPLAEAGALMTGVDLHQGLLDRCRRTLERSSGAELSKSVSLHALDFKSLASASFPEASGGFDLIILPYNGLYCLPDRRSQCRLIRAVLGQLSGAGSFWLDGYALPDPSEYEYESAEDFSPLTVLELTTEGGEERLLGVEEKDSFDLRAQVCEIEYRYCATPENEDHEPLHGRIERLTHRFVYPWQLHDLCVDAGARLQGLRAGFEGGDLDLSALKAIEWGIDIEHWVAQIKCGSRLTAL